MTKYQKKGVSNLKKIFIGLICIFLLFQIVSANQINQEDWRRLYDNSFNHFYNHEYEKSIECLEKALKLDLSQPAIYWRLSYVLWLKAQRDFHRNRDVKELKSRFNEVTNNGIEICTKMLETNQANPEILFYIGALYGHRGQFIASVNSRFKATLKIVEITKNIGKSREKLELIENRGPFYYEASGYLGVYNYGAALFAPVGGDEKLGLKQLEDAMRNSKYSDDFKIMYRGMLQAKIEENGFQNKISETIKLTEELLEKYPTNLSLKIDLVILYQKKGELVKAYDMGKQLHTQILGHLESSKFHYIRYSYIKLSGVLSEIKRTLNK